jgi:hypothetical protein
VKPPITTNGEDDDDDFYFPDPCVEDIILIKTVGSTEFPLPTDAVKIVSQDLSTVTVKLNQAWGPGTADRYDENQAPIDHIYYTYREDSFNQKCHEANEVARNKFYDTITINCHVTVPFALIEICVVDGIENGVLGSGDDATVPDCCYPEFPPDIPTVCYTVEIKCVTECVEDTERR